MISKGTSNEYPQPNFNAQKGQPMICPEFSKALSYTKYNRGLGSFNEKVTCLGTIRGSYLLDHWWKKNNSIQLL